MTFCRSHLRRWAFRPKPFTAIAFQVKRSRLFPAAFGWWLHNLKFQGSASSLVFSRAESSSETLVSVLYIVGCIWLDTCAFWQVFFVLFCIRTFCDALIVSSPTQF